MPKVITTHAAGHRYARKDVDYTLQGDAFVVTRDSVLENMKKVRVTVIVEEI